MMQNGVMQKFRYSKIKVIISLSVALFMLSSENTSAFDAPHFDSPRLSTQELNTNTQNILSTLFKPKIKVNFKEKNFTSGEIWSRVRSRLNLRAAHSSPLFKRHIRSFSQSQDYINKVVRNASPYLFFILEEVERRGMPSEIALLPIIESDFNPHTLSHRGAAGLWQIMPSLGRLHGLKQNAAYDGRKDIYESTKVALDHLAYLHRKFDGNWLLALAAYNCGEGKLSRAMRQNRQARKSTDFWSLKLPKETMHFVPKLLALATIIKSPKQYGVVLPNIPNQPVFTRISMGTPIDIARAAKLVDVSETQLRRLNPGHKKTARGPSHLLVPIHHASFVKEKIQHQDKSSAVKASKLASHDVAIVSKQKSKSPQKGKVHIVKKGESIPLISKKYKVRESKLLANNNLKKNSIIQPGQKIIISAKT